MNRPSIPGTETGCHREGRHNRLLSPGLVPGILLALSLVMLTGPVGARDGEGGASGTHESASAGLRLEDAERFAALMTGTAFRPTEQELRKAYLDPGSDALHAFARTRMGPPIALAQAVGLLRPDYRHAVERCLPAARGLAKELPKLIEETRHALGLVGEARTPGVVALFGVGRSAGTVENDTVILALEVICRYDRDGSDPKALLRAFLAHELVHVYQLREQQPGRRDSLLRQAMLEGYADLVARDVAGQATPPASVRARYGELHEARLWSEFRHHMAGTALAPWMYGPGRAGEPADLGYWLGLRISETLLETTDSPAESREALLTLEDPFRLLERSAYGEQFELP